MTRSSVWLIVKVAFLLWTFVSSVIWPPGGAEAVSATGAAVLAAILALASALMLLFLIGIQAVNPRSDAEWTYPRWTDSLLNFRQPLRFFHFCAFYSGAMAAGSLVAHVATGAENLWWVGAGAGLAIGMLLGVRLCWLIFRWKRGTPPRGRG